MFHLFYVENKSHLEWINVDLYSEGQIKASCHIICELGSTSWKIDSFTAVVY